MENTSSPKDQDTQRFSQNSTSEPYSASNKPNTNSPATIITVVFCVLILGLGGYLLLKSPAVMQKINSLQNKSDTTKTTDTNGTRKALENKKLSALPAGWTYKDNGECGVRFPVPPKLEPYYFPYDSQKTSSFTDDVGSGRYWDFPRGVVSSNVISSIVVSRMTNTSELKQVNAWFASDNEESGYISAAVSVLCAPNILKLNNRSMLDMFKTKLSDTGKIGKSEDAGMGAESYEIQSTLELSRWGYSVVDLMLSENYKNSGGTPYTESVKYTIFTTQNYLYEIRILGSSENAFVRETAQKIFDNLLFR